MTVLHSPDAIFHAWSAFQAAASLSRPRNHEEYRSLLAVMDDFTNRYSPDDEIYGPLFDLLAGYIGAWERDEQPPMRSVVGHEILAEILRERGLKQADLADLVDQGTLSKILRGERAISKRLAKALGERFHTPAALFLSL